MKFSKKWPYKETQAVLPRADYVAWIVSTDLPQVDSSPGVSVCSWLIRSLDGKTEHCPPPKRSRRDFSDEKRALGAALIGVMESLDQYSWVVLYAPGNYIRDGIKHAESWRDRGWRNKQNQRIAYPDIWIRYLKLLDERDIEIVLRRWRPRDYTSMRNELRHQVRAARRT